MSPSLHLLTPLRPSRRILAAAYVAGLLLIVAIVADVFCQKPWADRMRDWFGLAATLALVGLTYSYVRATDTMATATNLLASETRLQREQIFRPLIRMRFDIPESVLLVLKIENDGQDPALNVAFEFDPPLDGLMTTPLMSHPMFTKGAKYFPAKASYSFVLGSTFAFLAKTESQEIPSAYTVKCSYRGPDGRIFEESFILDLSHASGSRVEPESADTKALREIAKHLKDLVRLSRE